MAIGTIKMVAIDGQFGFIRQPAGEKDCFFHADDLHDDLDFGERLVELAVVFDLDDTPAKGPRARNVRLAD